jgi:hypothetical protein
MLARVRHVPPGQKQQQSGSVPLAGHSAHAPTGT